MNRLPMLVFSVVLTMTSGCGVIRNTLPSMDQVIQDAKVSAREPSTWLPLATAAAIGVTGTDNRITDWAVDETPIYGSQSRAGKVSDNLRDALVAGMVLSSVFAPTGTTDNAFPTRRVTANALTFGLIGGIVGIGKVTVGRERPNNRDDRSFPSGHSSAAFSSAILIEQNFNATVEKPWLRKSIKTGTYVSAAAVAWARVEAEEHHPIDVLVSAGLSNFIVKTFYSSIVSGDQNANTPLALEVGRQGFLVKFDHSF